MRGSTAGRTLAAGPPGYALGNDFAQFEGKTYISFPPFPALLMLPFVDARGHPRELPRRAVRGVARGPRAGRALSRSREAPSDGAFHPDGDRKHDAGSLFAFGTRLLLHRGRGHGLVRRARGRGRPPWHSTCSSRSTPSTRGSPGSCSGAASRHVRPSSSRLRSSRSRLFASRRREGFRRGAHSSTARRETWRRLDVRALSRRYAAFAAPIVLVFVWCSAG